jgi:hypothetical protein
MKYQIRYTDHQTEDAVDTLEEAVADARRIYEMSGGFQGYFPANSLFAKIKGIYCEPGSILLLGRNMLAGKFGAEDEAALTDDERDERDSLSSHNFQHGTSL